MTFEDIYFDKEKFEYDDDTGDWVTLKQRIRMAI
jgi:hypothetical protein